MGYPEVSRMESLLRKTSARNMALLELLKQMYNILLIFGVSFKTIKWLKKLCHMLALREMEFLRDPQCLKSDLVQGRPPNAPVAKLCRGAQAGEGRAAEVPGVGLWKYCGLQRNTQGR